MKNTIVVSDVDGILTDGGLYYSYNGKVMKRFGSNDHEAVDMLKDKKIDVQFITADRQGFNINEQRIVTDWKCSLDLVLQKNRIEFLKKKTLEYREVFFFGDGPFDAKAKEALKDKIVFMCPTNAHFSVKNAADYVSSYIGGNNAFLDMALKVLETQKCI